MRRSIDADASMDQFDRCDQFGDERQFQLRRSDKKEGEKTKRENKKRKAKKKEGNNFISLTDELADGSTDGAGTHKIKTS